MPATRTDRNQVFDRNGNLLSEQVVTVNVTADDLRAKAAAALAANSTFLAVTSPTQAQAVARVQRLTRQVNALIRLLLAGDLLLDNPDT